MPSKPDTLKGAERDRKYVKFKMKEIKKEKKRGNEPAARRHATELFQYLSLGTGGETPIEGELDRLE